MQVDAMGDIRELLNGLEIECELDDHDTSPTHSGPAKYICHMVCPGCGYSETATMCAPAALRTQRAEAVGWMFTMSACCGGRFLIADMNTWEKL